MEARQYTLNKYLIEKSREGDRQAQGELYNLYVKAMYNICLRMMGNEDDAKDVLQEAFVTAFSRLSSLKDLNLFSAWLKRIVINTSLNALKKKKDVFTDLEGVEIADDEYSSDDFDYGRFKVEKVMDAISNLPRGARTVLNLYIFEGYDHKEIGGILGITESASKAQYSKAKSKIRSMLDEGMMFKNTIELES